MTTASHTARRPALRTRRLLLALVLVLAAAVMVVPVSAPASAQEEPSGEEASLLDCIVRLEGPSRRADRRQRPDG
ncbi:MAG: hypothetical protein U5R31_07200 [Acidimicrobiia bacterium]|nr:hypothetical protein [Acidimicrobiia bacterium]